jgi:acetoin utilization protein AcuB
MMIKVRDLMTEDPLSLEPDDTIQQAEELMEENKIRQLPVVSDSELVGIITDRDIRSFLSGHLLGPVKERQKAMNTKIASVMTEKPVTLSPDDDLSEAVELLIEEKVGGIPVVDEEEALVGIVTQIDVLRCFLERLQEE